MRMLFRLIPICLALTLSGSVAGAKPARLLDVADTIANNRILTKLSAMVQNSDLAAFLSSKGPFTFFAPTDSAFSKIPPETMELLLQPQNKERLQHILLFHAINNKKLMARDLVPLPTLLTCEGNPLTLKTNKLGTQFVLKAKIIHADIRCSNGVIHEIDAVLLPPESSLPPLSQAPPPPPPTPTPDTNTPPAAATPDTNGAPITPSPDTNAPSAATNVAPATPDAPMSTDTNAPPVAPPATSPH